MRLWVKFKSSSAYGLCAGCNRVSCGRCIGSGLLCIDVAFRWMV